jgi:hypothetical protein
MWSTLLPCALFLGGDGRGVVLRDDPWAGLDRAVAALAPERADGPFAHGVLLRAFFSASAAEGTDDSDGPDASGFLLEDVDAYAAYDQGDVAWRLSVDLDQGTPELEDAFARWQHWEGLALTVGQFKPRVLRSASIPPEALLFRERTFLGAALDDWDDGFELGGHYDQWDYWLTLADGANGSGSDHFTSARVEWALYDAAFEDREGARGAPNHLRALLGVAWFVDAALSNSEGGGWGADLALTFGPYSFHGEWAGLDAEFARTIDVFNGYLITLGDGDPVSATLSRCLGPEAEVALRFQRADDADDTRSLGFGMDWNPSGGPARFVADLELVEGDTRDFSLFSLGVVLGSSGLARPFGGLP